VISPGLQGGAPFHTCATAVPWRERTSGDVPRIKGAGLESTTDPSCKHCWAGLAGWSVATEWLAT